MIWRNRNFLLPAAWALLILPASAAEKPDLGRVTPVPASEPVPIEDFFRPRLLQEPRLNLAGTHVAAIVTVAEDRHQLLVYELKTRKGELVGGVGDRDIWQVNWLDDRRLVFQLSGLKLWGLALFAANVGSLKEAYPLMQYLGSSLVAVPEQTRLHPLVWNRYDALRSEHDLGVVTVNTDRHSGQFVDLLRAGFSSADVAEADRSNAEHMEAHWPVPDAGIVWHYQADREGNLAFALVDRDGRPSLSRLENGHWQDCPVNLDEIDVVGSGETPGQLIVTGPRQDGKPRALQNLDAATGRLGEVLLQDEAYDFSDGWLYRDPATLNVVGVVYQRNGPQVTWFSEDYRRLQKSLNALFPGLIVRIIGSDKAKKTFLLATFSDRQPVIYSWIDLENHTGGLIKNSSPWIDAKRMQPMTILEFTTRDGHRLDAYVTFPAGASKQNPPPLVVLPHGGPWARDTWGFDPEVQFLASRGYAVLQPNYRGSLGYGWRFPKEDEWDFIKMHDDVTDATRTLTASGLVDARRVAIMGGSFGGYLALSGVVREPTLYRCAISIAGVFDWEQQIRADKYYQYDDTRYGYLLRHLGDPIKDKEKFEAISPGRHVEQIRVPVFVAGGKEDQTVEITQSKRLVSALERNHVPHEVFFLHDEGHGMRHIANQTELYSRIEAFLAKNLAPVGAAAAVPAPASTGTP